MKTGGRWCPDAATFLGLMVRCRAGSAPPPLQSACIPAYALPWSALLGFAAGRAFATSLLSLPHAGAANVEGDPPLLSDLLAEPGDLRRDRGDNKTVCEGNKRFQPIGGEMWWKFGSLS